MSGVGEHRNQDMSGLGLGRRGNPHSSSHGMMVSSDSVVVGKHTCGKGCGHPLNNTGHCDTVACFDTGVTHTNQSATLAAG